LPLLRRASDGRLIVHEKKKEKEKKRKKKKEKRKKKKKKEKRKKEKRKKDERHNGITTYSKEGLLHVRLHVVVIEGHDFDKGFKGSHLNSGILALGGLTNHLQDVVPLPLVAEILAHKLKGVVERRQGSQSHLTIKKKRKKKKKKKKFEKSSGKGSRQVCYSGWSLRAPETTAVRI